jgi:hypothetical protein
MTPWRRNIRSLPSIQEIDGSSSTGCWLIYLGHAITAYRNDADVRASVKLAVRRNG